MKVQLATWTSITTTQGENIRKNWGNRLQGLLSSMKSVEKTYHKIIVLNKTFTETQKNPNNWITTKDWYYDYNQFANSIR